MPPKIISYKKRQRHSWDKPEENFHIFLMYLRKFPSYFKNKDLIITSAISLKRNTTNCNEQCYDLHAESRGTY